MTDPEQELARLTAAIKYIITLETKLNAANKHKSALGTKFDIIRQQLMEYLETKKAQLTKKVNRISEEVIAMTEVIADTTEKDWY